MEPRTIVWFSCGASSAVAAKMLAVEKTPNLVVVYTDPGAEHPDNQRFLRDCEEWIGHKIIQLKSEKYTDTWDVFEKTRFLSSPAGARCTAELKRKVRFKYQRPDDKQAFGFTIEETARAQRFCDNNPEVDFLTPLIDRGLTKPDCLALIDRAGIELPVMYKMGYDHNNCIGCVKGGMGYWNRIRVDFPEAFDRMAKLERSIGASVNKDKNGPVYLDELDPSRGSMATEPNIECSLVCSLTEEDFNA